MASKLRRRLLSFLTIGNFLFSTVITLHGETVTYVYDELNRLIEIRYEAGTGDSTPPTTTASPSGGVYNVSQTVTLLGAE
jgi:hypothetical protein